MKITKFILAAALMAGFSMQLTSCSDDDAPVVYYPVTLSISLPAEIENSSIIDEEYLFKNVSTNETLKFVSEDGIELVPGLYDITYTAHVRLSNGVTSTMRAMSQSVQINQGENSIVLTAYNTIESDDLIIVEVFNNGTCTSTGAQVRDSYIKLYNNTDHVIYADGLTLFESNFATTQKYDYTPDIMDQAVVVRFAYTVPGNGARFPVQPGEYFLMVDRANDNRLTSELGFDLTHADVEWYDESSVASQQDTDNPNVPNMDKIFSYSKSITMLDQAQRAFGIARLGTDAESFLANNAYTANYEFTAPNGNVFNMTVKDVYYIPNSAVVDVVNVAPRDNYVWNVTSPALDCGWTWNLTTTSDKTGYFHSMRRKMLYINEDGNPVFKDTNNSTEDFNTHVVASEIELQGTAMDVDGNKATVITYDGVTPVE